MRFILNKFEEDPTEIFPLAAMTSLIVGAGGLVLWGIALFFRSDAASGSGSGHFVQVRLHLRRSGYALLYHYGHCEPYRKNILRRALRGILYYPRHRHYCHNRDNNSLLLLMTSLAFLSEGLFHFLSKREIIFLYSSIRIRIELAMMKIQQIAQAGIDTVCKKVEKIGTFMTRICSNKVQKIPTAMNQLLFSGTVKAERLSLRQLNT